MGHDQYSRFNNPTTTTTAATTLTTSTTTTMISPILATRILAGLVALYILYALLAPLFSPLRKIPGPLAARFTKAWYFTRVSKGDFHRENTLLHRKYGPVVRLAPNYVSLDEPSVVKTVYGIGSKFPKSDWYQGFKAPGPKVPFTLFADQDIRRHAENRKIFQNVYSMSSMVSYEPFVDRCADLLAARLREIADGVGGGGRERGAGELDMAHWFQAYAFDVVACVTFGSRFGFLDRGEDVFSMMAQLHSVVRYSALAGLFPRVHAWLFYPSARLGLFGSRGRVAHMAFVERRMAVRAEERTSEEARKPQARDGDGDGAAAQRDFMDRLWDKHDEDPDRVSRYHIFMVGLSNITAGSDTTSSTLSGLLYLLLSHPRALARLTAELDAAALSDPPTFKEGQALPYLDAAIKESLRLHSAVGLPLWRVVPPGGGLEVAGHLLPPGTNVGVNAWTAHRNPAVWGADAGEFRPERWLEADRSRLAAMEAYYLPFGLGARTCIGRHISILEVVKLMPRLLREFEFGLARPEDGMTCDDFWFVLPKNFMVNVKRREKA